MSKRFKITIYYSDGTEQEYIQRRGLVWGNNCVLLYPQDLVWKEDVWFVPDPNPTELVYVPLTNIKYIHSYEYEEVEDNPGEKQ